MDIDSLRAAFDENFALHGELGAAVSVWEDGKETASLAGGWQDRQQTKPWEADTPVLVWSATKGPAAACVLHAMQEHNLSLMDRVAEVWPEFAQAGKERVTLGQALCHESGVPVLDARADVFDHDSVATAIAAQAPHWSPGTAHGYGPRVYGYLLDELVRRIAGKPLGEYWQEIFAAPMALEFWIGLPSHLQGRVSSVFPPKSAPPAGDRFYAAFASPGSFSARAFASPVGLHTVASMNSPEARSASLPGFGGIGTARALAKFYAMLACGGVMDGRTFFARHTLDWMTTTLTQGDDRVLLAETAFSAGFMRDPVGPAGKLRKTFGPGLLAFGHPGAGGSHAFADPERRLGFAYVMNQMNPGVLPGGKALRLVEALG